jgi:hypothetical protein
VLKKTLFIASSMMLISACASFYETSNDFNQQFEQGNIDAALEQLKNDRLYSKNNNRLLYYVNRGLLLSMEGKYEASNKAFEKAYLFGEDFKVNYASEAASFLVNPMITVYRGEDHENLMPLYFKALNFLKLEKYDEALVECKRLNIRLQQLSDKYKSPDKFQEDAFIHNLMGIIYQTTGDWNNAFIAYRNAYDIYQTDYVKFFGIESPEQLKRDLLVSAWNTGFKDEFDLYKEKFGWPDFKVEPSEAELLFFWHNGLCPVKDEWSINFVVDHNNSNLTVFSSDQLPFQFPYNVNRNNNDDFDLKDHEAFRVAFPKYVERPVYYSTATIQSDSATYPLQLAEDVNKIAFKSLQERMFLEFSKSLMRAAIKKAAEKSARKEDKGFGAIVGMVNAFTEKADTRNWQTLPHSISYARVPMKEGKNEINFTLYAEGGDKGSHAFSYFVKKGQTLFHTFSSLESRPANRY